MTTLYDFRLCEFGTTCYKRVEKATRRNSILGYMDGMGMSSFHVVNKVTALSNFYHMWMSSEMIKFQVNYYL